MAANLCCTAEQQGRPDSPELPNARIRNTAPAHLPLLPNRPGSPNSHFTSARTGELLELQHIFEGAREHGSSQAPPAQKPRQRFSRTSMYSLHNLHKMTSMRSIIKRRFSKDLIRKNSSTIQSSGTIPHEIDVNDQNTVVRQPRDQANDQLKITKHDLRKDLLSEKGPEEGGYDSDARVLDDVAKNVGRKLTGKRPSVHSINWSASMGSKPTPASSTRTRCDAKPNLRTQPYEIRKPRPVSFSTRVSHIFSTPNLRADFNNGKDHGVRRSQSTTSMGLPRVSPLSPLRLPSLVSHSKDGRSWAEILEESFRFPQFPIPPNSVDLRSSETVLRFEQNLAAEVRGNLSSEFDKAMSQTAKSNSPKGYRHDLELDAQQSILGVGERPIGSVRGIILENTQPVKSATRTQKAGADEGHEIQDPRRSVHLHSMRISHHLRSGSLLSWDQLADTSELSSPSRPLRQRTVSEQSRSSHFNRHLSQCERQTSSSGFASSRTPSKWGKVIYQDRDLLGDVASSIYSSRPHSRPDSFGGSMANLDRNFTGTGASKNSFNHSPGHKRSNSFPTDDEETPRPIFRHGRAIMLPVQDPFVETNSCAPGAKLARKNSVADTKTSKFREELDPTPPQKKTTPTASLLKFLNPKRLSMHSQSEGSLKSASSIRTGDGGFDILPAPVDRERRQSRSLMSLNAERQALQRSKGTDQVWDQALRAHQKEKASLFLPENRELAIHSSPFRRRSGSGSPRHSNETESYAANRPESTPRRPSMALSKPDAPERPPPHPVLVTRRSAVSGQDVDTPERELSNIFDRQGDGIEVVGAWGRYPSHTRVERTFSAGKSDRVESRDFALEAAIRFASTRPTDEDEDEIDPMERIPSLPLLPGQKRRKKKVGSGRMVKSNSMTFGKSFLKNYTRIFKSQSSDFRKHGKNHRSSITTGGTLEFPELELLPEVWTGKTSQEGTLSLDKQQRSRQGVVEADEGMRLPTEDSSSTLRPRRYSDVPDLGKRLFHDGSADFKHGYDRARAWSAYYETCMPAISRLNSEADLSLDKAGAASRFSFGSRPSSMRSRTIPAAFMKHSRDASNVSGISALSDRSAEPKFLALIDDGTTMDKRSIFGLRRSTMDLMLQFKEQETTEHERVMSFTRSQSRRGTVHTKTL